MSHHYSDTLVIRCVDDNFNHERPYSKGFDRIAVDADCVDYFGPIATFGGSLAFGNDDFCRFLLGELKTARALGIKRVVLADHLLYCGAFELKFGPMTAEEKRTRHLEYIQIAREFFARNAPDFIFLVYLLNEDTNEFECLDDIALPEEELKPNSV